MSRQQAAAIADADRGGRDGNFGGDPNGNHDHGASQVASGRDAEAELVTVEGHGGVRVDRSAGGLTGGCIHPARHVERHDGDRRLADRHDRRLDATRRRAGGARAKQRVDHEVGTAEEIGKVTVGLLINRYACRDCVVQRDGGVAGRRARRDANDPRLAPVLPEQARHLVPIAAVVARPAGDHDLTGVREPSPHHPLGGRGGTAHQVDTGNATVVDGVRIDRARAGGVVEERLHGGHLHTGSVLPRDGLPPELDGPSG